MDDRVPAIATLAALASDRIRDSDDGAASRAPRPWTDEAAQSADAAIASFEGLVAALEGGSSAVAFGSPAAMLHALARVLLRPGDQIVAARELASELGPLLDGSFPGFGWQVAWSALDDRASFEDAISPRTKVILAPSVGSDGSVADFAMLTELARRAGVPLVVDNTLATPALCRPIDHGANIVVHATSANLGGRDVAAGVIVDGGNFDWQREGRHDAVSKAQPQFGNAVLAETFGNFALAAACRLIGLNAFSPLAGSAAADLVDGMATLALRLDRQRATAQHLAEWLDRRSDIAWVGHSGLPGNRHHNLAKRYVGAGGAPLISFQPADQELAAVTLASALAIFKPVQRLGVGGRSQIEAVAGAQGARFYRLWVGIESEADLVADLDQALNSLAANL